MRIICDTHALLFWSDAQDRLGKSALLTMEHALTTKTLACSDVSLWEIAMLFAKGRLRQDVNAVHYMNDIIAALELEVLPVTPEIAVLAQSTIFHHKDPADRLIGATAIHCKAKLVTADAFLQGIPGLEIIW
ncbi:MAG: type II toxin-antitoxin system VapC family toxin [Magnetococcales bacterium]|nr:type II toxin-antitoxin system VapC family toxin [Magnetococcales bacterium]